MTRFLERHACAVLFLTLLALCETAMIDVLVLPYNSSREDWLITTLVLAPLAALAILLATMVTVRVTADIAAVARHLVKKPPH